MMPSQRLLFVFLVLSTAVHSAHASLVAHWKLNDGKDGPTQVVVDSSNSGFNGTLGASDKVGAEDGDPAWVTTGMSTAKLDPVAKLGAVLQFNNSGGGTFVNFNSHAAQIGSLNDCTIALWVRLKKSDIKGGPQSFMCISDNTRKSTGAILCSDESPDKGSPRFLFRESGLPVGADLFPKTNPLTPEEWHHVAVTASQSSGVRLYVDGKEVAAKPDAIVTLSSLTDANDTINTVILGAEDDERKGVHWRLAGCLSSVQIYDLALNPEQITFLADPKNLGTPVP
jgi:hypothetical protein